MPITKEDLQDFSRFAGEKLERGQASSLVELAGEWEAQRGGPVRIEVDICEIHPNVDAKTLSALAGAFPEADASQLQQAISRRGGVTTAQMLANAAKKAAEE